MRVRPPIIALLALLASVQAAFAQKLPRGLKTLNPVEFQIDMMTSLKVPQMNWPCVQVRVWHALPTLRPWSASRYASDASQISFQPRPAKIEPEKDHRSSHVFWDTKRLMPTGTELSYRSRFTVKSYDRIFEPANAHVTWLDFQNARLPAEKYSEPLSPELVKLVNDTRRKHQPAAAIQVLCRWVKENINYDASVWWPNEEVKATVSYRKGHCGHMVNVFRQICAIAGIPYRIVYGMNLTVPNGVDALANVREDFTNAHTWAEVFFPNVGWIEVEVASGKNCFAISRCFVQNNSDFENYSIWVTEKDQLTRVPVWKFVDGKFVCDYSVKHRITYTERDLAPRVPFER